MANFIRNVYDKHYKPLLIISVLLVVLSIGTIGYKYYTTGDFVSRGVSLTGGLTMQIPEPASTSPDDLSSYLSQKFPKADISVMSFGQAENKNFDIEASGVNESDFVAALQEKFPSLTLDVINKNKGTVGPEFGAEFFVQTLKAVFIAFLFMSIVIFLYFGESAKWKWIAGAATAVAALMIFYSSSLIMYILPIIIFCGLVYLYIRQSIISFGIVLCAISDVLFSLAIFNLFGMKLSIAGVAAFLMLVGYSIDTDILLSVRVQKRREGSVFDRVVGALKTGVTMSSCAFIAVLIAYLFTHSVVIKEIMFILMAGLIGDVIFTWIQNAGILRWYLEGKGWH